MNSRGSKKVERGRGGLLERIVHRFESQPALVVEILMLCAVAGGIDQWIRRAAVVVYLDAVGALEARSNRKFVHGDHADTNNDYIGRMLGAVFSQDRTDAARMRLAGECTHLRIADDPDTMP